MVGTMWTKPAILSAIVLLTCVPLALATGEPVGTFPGWEERAVQQLMNRARVDPASELAGCGSNCSAAELTGCYVPVAPLTWAYQLNQSARFHSASMAKNSFFAHDTPFVVRNDIAGMYPASCDGTASCASSGAGTTSAPTRISLFGGTMTGEIIAAGQGSPTAVFYVWLYEPAPAAACGFSSANGHRYLILTGGPAVGAGFSAGGPYAKYWSGDFGYPAAPIPKVPSGSHWGPNGERQAASVAFWANWYSSAGPLSAQLFVDSVAYPMTLGRGSQTNGAWTTSVSGLGTGCHRYYFSFQDAAGTTRYPTNGTLGVGPAATCPDYQSATTAASGDVNGDGVINAADVFHLINHLFAGGPAPVGKADVNADGATNAADVIYLISYLFAAGQAPR